MVLYSSKTIQFSLRETDWRVEFILYKKEIARSIGVTMAYVVWEIRLPIERLHQMFCFEIFYIDTQFSKYD